MSPASAQAKAEPKSVYAVYGSDTFRKREAVERICRTLESDIGAEISCRFDGDEADLASVLDEVRTYSLLGGTRIVIVDNADALISAHRPALERYCEEPADSGVLVLVSKSLAANTRLHKIIARKGTVTRCDTPKGRDIVDWMLRRASDAYGKKLDPRAAWKLREFSGDSLEALDGELTKLSLFVGDRPAIRLEDVEDLVGNQREQNVFGVIDAMASGDAATALHQWERVLATDRAAPARAIGGLAWGIRRLIELKHEAEQGTPLNVLARKAYTRPDELRRRLSLLTVDQLQQQLSELMEADLASKTGASTVPVAIERFIVRQTIRATRKPRRVS
jgi:DNA polymerase-3 subunit delta